MVATLFAAALLHAAGSTSGTAQVLATLCIPPAVPVIPSDAALQLEFRAVLAEEFQLYFSLMGDYMTCLNNAQAVAQEEVRQAIDDYNALIENLPSVSLDMQR